MVAKRPCCPEPIHRTRFTALHPFAKQGFYCFSHAVISPFVVGDYHAAINITLAYLHLPLTWKRNSALYFSSFQSFNDYYSDCYVQRRALLSPAERSFYGVLDQSLSDHFQIFTKIRTGDIFTPKFTLSRAEYTIAWNKIKAKHIDFILCDKETLSIIALIELDDSTHNRPQTIERDKFINSVCSKTGIPLIRFKVEYSYQLEQVRKRVLSSIGTYTYH